MLKRHQSAYYVLTPSGFLLEYQDEDLVLHQDPTLSLKLADCDLGNSPSKSGKAEFTSISLIRYSNGVSHHSKMKKSKEPERKKEKVAMHAIRKQMNPPIARRMSCKTCCEIQHFVMASAQEAGREAGREA
jgi:hypothetical protein